MRPASSATRRITPFALCLLLLPVAACDKSPSVSATNTTPAEVQAKVVAATGGGITVEPGRWEGTMTMHDMELPNMPPQVKAQMKTRMGAPRSFVSCVTAEDVKEQKAFFTGEEKGERACKYDHFTLAGGKIDAAMQCGGAASRMAMTMTGRYAPDSYSMDMTSKAQSGGPMAGMTMKMSVAAKRVGACKGTKDEL